MHDMCSQKTPLDDNSLASNCRLDFIVRLWSLRRRLFAADKNENWKEHGSHCTSAETQGSQALASTYTIAVRDGQRVVADLRDEVQLIYPTCLLVLTAVSKMAEHRGICHPRHS
jgi:hypothetical protein